MPTYCRLKQVLARSNKLTRGTPELVQHFRYIPIGGVHIGAAFWFGYIVRLP
jgi:hypothetical protein